MANNRMYLCCTVCALDEATTLEDCVFFLAKYYPNTGWYIRGGKTLKRDDGEQINFVDAADEWFDQHKHGGMYGEYIYTIFEDTIYGNQTDSKRGILDGVQRVLLNARGDKS